MVEARNKDMRFVRKVSLKTYIKEKIKMLTDPRGFALKLTDADIQHFNELKTEIAVDNFARKIIMGGIK